MSSSQSFSTNLGLSTLPEFTQSKYPGIWQDNMRIRNALRIIQGALDNYTGAPVPNPSDYAGSFPAVSPSIFCPTSEALTLGSLVNLYDVTGALTARKASATDSTKPCRAICVSPGGVAVGATGQFALFGSIAAFSGVVNGASYYLSATLGGITSVAPAVPGNIVQAVGFGIASNRIWFNPALTWITI